MKSDRKKETNYKKELISFDKTDRLGRKVGVAIYTYNLEFVPVDDNAKSWYRINPGHYYVLRTRTTRNGKNFGAIQNEKFFKNASERKTAINKYIVESSKRANK